MKTYHILFKLTDYSMPTGKNFQVADGDPITAISEWKEAYAGATFLACYTVDQGGNLEY